MNTNATSHAIGATLDRIRSEADRKYHLAKEEAADALAPLASHPDPIVRGTVQYERTVDHLLEVSRKYHKQLVECIDVLWEIRPYLKDREDIDDNGNPNWAMQLVVLIDEATRLRK